MIRNAAEMETEIREKLRGGNGKAKLSHIFKQGEMTEKAKICARVELEKGSSIGWHVHLEEEEIYFILKGKALVNDNGVEKEIGEGDAVLTGGGAGHAIANIGDEPLVFFAIIISHN